MPGIPLSLATAYDTVTVGDEVREYSLLYSTQYLQECCLEWACGSQASRSR